MKDIKYILWDVDRTLIDFDYAEKEALKKCYTQYGFGELTEELLEEYIAYKGDSCCQHGIDL